MTNYEMSDALHRAMKIVDRLCDQVGRTYFVPADPDSEFHWGQIIRHENRKDLYTKVTSWLLEDHPAGLHEKETSLNAVVDNLCAQLDRFSWIFTPVVHKYEMDNIQVFPNKVSSPSMKSWASAEFHEAEQLDMCMNSGCLFHMAQQRLDAYNDVLNNITIDTIAPKIKM